MKKIKTSPLMPSDVEIEKISDTEVKIYAYPFESGYAISVAHPLRRLLLGSTVGYSPIAIKIDGASHEFDSIRGVLEDVTEFIINLKNIRFKIKNDEDRAEVEYKFEGAQDIKGADLENDQVEIVTPEAFLATLNEEAKLKFSIVIHKGIGYVPSEEIRDELEEGFIPLDAFFTPVTDAIYDIEKVLVGDNPNFEKIVFTIKTDGQTDPISVFKESLKVMYEQMSVFNDTLSINLDDLGENRSDSDDLSDFVKPIDTLDLSARSANCLDRAGIKYVGELLLMGPNEIKDIKNLGKKSLDEIKEKLDELSLPSKDDLGPKEVMDLKDKIEKLKS
jgi:DNA-directed RNA polymerase subunit alpha